MNLIKNFRYQSLIGLIAVFILTFSYLTMAGDNQKIIIGETFTIKSEVLNEERTILVYLPVGYETSDQHYPVMYVLDGKTHFIHASGIVEFLSGQGIIPQTILVAITNVDRNRDFTPTKIDENSTYGGADQFMSFIEEELKPYVNENYRSKSYETIAGHSLGGLYVTYTFLKNPDMFDSYIAISPYLMFDNNLLIDLTAENILKKYRNEKFFYMTLGDEPGYTKTVEAFVKIIKKESPSGLDFHYIHMTNENHGSIPHLSIYNGLEANYPDWQISNATLQEGLAAIDKHYKFISKKYGYNIETPEYIINALGYQYLGKNEIDKAIEVFAENVKRYPGSANVYDSLGEAYENNSQLVEARNNYDKAVSIAKNGDYTFLKTYESNLERINNKLVK